MSNIENAILSSFRAGIVAIGLDGAVAYVNPIGAKILEGCPLKEGENIHSRAGENSFFRVLSEAITMNYLPTRVEVELSGKDGDRQYLGFTLSDLRDRDQRVGICAFFKDLTQVEMAEENENLKQRLLLLGQMAAGLAHEIRNPIAGIGVHCSILKSHLSQNEKLMSSVNMMAVEIARVEYIIRECLNFVRPAELGIKYVQVDQVVSGIVERLRVVHPGIEFTMKKPKGVDLLAEVDPSLLEQAVANILANAIEACEGKGNIDVSFGVTRHFSDLVKLGRKVEPIVSGHSGKEEDFIRISIRDDGPGIPIDIQDKIFVPFFTTKKTGTGIGLPMAQKIVHAHGGVMDLTSDPGKGTEFVIKIPVRQKSGE
jgi:two-component system nitrogen regulation sensor histidine kinase GlnL